MAKNGSDHSSKAKGSVETINIMVVGECGDGKSTLVNGLRDPDKCEAAVCDKNPKGVTKDIVLYPCRDINGVPFNILDTPGVGDHEVRPTALISMIEEFLKSGMVPGGVRGVVVTTPVPDGRIRLGAQIVQAIVDKGFVVPAGADKYGNIILCGTKVDKADSEDKETFENGVKPAFFEKSTNQTGPCVMVSHKDYTPLLDAIKKLPAMAIAYVKPKAKEMAAALADTLGIDPKEFQGQMEEMRKLVEEQSQQLKDVLGRLHEESERNRKEMKQKDEMIQNMVQEIQEFQRKVEAARLEREAEREKVRREQDEDRCKARQEAAKQQELIMRKMEEQQQAAQQEMEKMQQQRAAAEAEHRRVTQQMQVEHRKAMEQARNSIRSRSGGGCLIL